MQELKTILENELSTKVTVQDNVLKFHTKKLTGNNVAILNDLYLSDSLNIADLEIKRSGTGLTILVTLEN